MNKSLSEYKQFINTVKENRQRRIEGKYNSIPWAFERLSKEHYYPGWEKGTICLITANTHGGKSRLAKFLVIISNFIMWKKSNKSFDIKILWFALEESRSKLLQEMICIEIFRRHKKVLSPEKLRSSGEYTVPEEVIRWIEEAEESEFIKFFLENVVVIDHIMNPTGIMKYIRNYFKNPELGEMEYEERDGEKYPVIYKHKKDTYYFGVFDHISLLHPENKKTKLETIEFFMNNYLLNECIKRYNMVIVPVQQQTPVSEHQQFTGKGGLIEKKLEPSLAELGDCKSTSQTADIVLGLFNPSKFEIPFHEDYNIELLTNSYRSIKFLKDRPNGMNGTVGLYFAGVPYFEELPTVEKMTGKYEHYIEKRQKENYLKDLK